MDNYIHTVTYIQHVYIYIYNMCVTCLFIHTHTVFYLAIKTSYIFVCTLYMFLHETVSILASCAHSKKNHPCFSLRVEYHTCSCNNFGLCMTTSASPDPPKLRVWITIWWHWHRQGPAIFRCRFRGGGGWGGQFASICMICCAMFIFGSSVTSSWRRSCVVGTLKDSESSYGNDWWSLVFVEKGFAEADQNHWRHRSDTDQSEDLASCKGVAVAMGTCQARFPSRTDCENAVSHVRNTRSCPVMMQFFLKMGSQF